MPRSASRGRADIRWAPLACQAQVALPRAASVSPVCEEKSTACPGVGNGSGVAEAAGHHPIYLQPISVLCNTSSNTSIVLPTWRRGTVTDSHPDHAWADPGWHIRHAGTCPPFEKANQRPSITGSGERGEVCDARDQVRPKAP